MKAIFKTLFLLALGLAGKSFSQQIPAWSTIAVDTVSASGALPSFLGDWGYLFVNLKDTTAPQIYLSSGQRWFPIAIGSNTGRVRRRITGPGIANFPLQDTLFYKAGSGISLAKVGTDTLLITAMASGDITDVGDVASGAAFTGAQGTQLIFDGGASDGALARATLTGARNWTLSDNSGVIALHASAVSDMAGLGLSVSGTTQQFDATELGNLTWGTGGAASLIWDFNLSAGDPQLTLGNGVFNVSSGTLQQGGTAVVLQSRTLSATSPARIDGGASADLSANRTISITQNAGTDITADLEEETHVSEHQDGGNDELSVTGLSGLLADAQKVAVRKNSGALAGTRQQINFIEGSNISLTIADDAVTPEVDVTIAATGVGEINTGINLGGGLNNFDSKSGVDLRFNTFAAADFDLAANLITIDDAKWAKDSELHAAVTLAADVDVLLGLSTQQLNLDAQSANLVFAGPASGAAADPTFRSLVDDDVPNTITLSNLTQIATRNHTDLAGLTTTDAGHTQFALLAGRSGGQTLNGGTAAAEDLILQSTANATKGLIQLGGKIFFQRGLNVIEFEGDVADVNDLVITIQEPTANDNNWTLPAITGTFVGTASSPLSISSAGNVSLGTVGVGNGGTGLTATPSNGQLLIGNGSGYTLATLTDPTNGIDISNGAGAITVNFDPTEVNTVIWGDGTISTLTWQINTSGGTANDDAFFAFSQDNITFANSGTGATTITLEISENYQWTFAPGPTADDITFEPNYPTGSIGSQTFYLKNGGGGVVNLNVQGALTLGTDLSVPNGGTGASTFTSNGVLLGNGTSAIQITAAGTANQVLRIPSGGGAPAFGQVNLASSSAVTGTLGDGNLSSNVTFLGGRSGGQNLRGGIDSAENLTLESTQNAVKGQIRMEDIIYFPDVTTIIEVEGTADANEAQFIVTNPTADRQYTFPNASGTVTLLGNTTTGSGSIVLDTSPTLSNPDVKVIQGANSKNLGEGFETSFVQIDIASNSFVAGIVEYAVHADNGIDFQVRSGSFNFNAVNKAGTETASISSVIGEIVTTSTGTLTVSFATNTAPTNAILLRANATSSLTQTTLAIKYKVIINSGIATVTPQ